MTSWNARMLASSAASARMPSSMARNDATPRRILASTSSHAASNSGPPFDAAGPWPRRMRRIFSNAAF